MKGEFIFAIPKLEIRKSSGGVVVYKNKILAIKTKNLKNEDVWTFPKGQIEDGESQEEAALREVEEETGYKCRIVKFLDTVEYWFWERGVKVKKTVYWYLMEPLGKVGEHDFEISEVRFFSPDEIKQILSYPSDKKLVDKVLSVMQDIK